MNKIYDEQLLEINGNLPKLICLVKPLNLIRYCFSSSSAVQCQRLTKLNQYSKYNERKLQLKEIERILVTIPFEIIQNHF